MGQTGGVNIFMLLELRKELGINSANYFISQFMSVIADIRRTASAADLAYQSFIKHCLQNQPYIKEGAATSDSFARFHHEMDEHRENRR